MTEATTAPKPIPEPDETSEPFWKATLEGKLLLMKCSDCGGFRLPSRQHCDRCLSAKFEWTPASGRGTVRSFGRMHQVYHPAFAEEVPYTLAIVELEEGPRLPTNIVDLDGREVRVDMPVELTWERHEDVALPKFRSRD
jgi:uncharacterized protein